MSEFIERLAHELITNTHDQDRVTELRERHTPPKRGWEAEERSPPSTVRKKKRRESDEDPAVARYLWHTPVNVKRERRKVRQVTCRICGSKCSLLCSRCSNIENGLYYGLCNPTTGRDCLAQHVLTVIIKKTRFGHKAWLPQPLAFGPIPPRLRGYRLSK